MKYTLPISPTYVAHWGLWEAVREIYQNALDQGNATMTYDKAETLLTISTPTGQLTPDTLILGTTSKRNDPMQRGKFGEGYKLALVVLKRLNHPVSIRTGKETWVPLLEHDAKFGAGVLNIYTTRHKNQAPVGVEFRIFGVTAVQYDKIRLNIRPADEIYSTILKDSEEKGRIYVGGLYVYTAEGFHYGYAFRPDAVKLDRDRGMINGFDLAYETSRLWTASGHSPVLAELLDSEAPDVEYVDLHVSASHPVVSDHYSYFIARHGAETIPVSTQDEIQRATTAGRKWVLVPAKVQDLLRLVGSWLLPSIEKPIERLKKFRASIEYRVERSLIRELDDIIKSLEQ